MVPTQGADKGGSSGPLFSQYLWDWMAKPGSWDHALHSWQAPGHTTALFGLCLASSSAYTA